MRSPSIDRLHADLEKQIRLAQSYTEVEELEFIIKACRLKPHDYLFGKHDNKIILYRWWLDEFGNSLMIKKKGKLEIVYGDLKLDRDKIISTDLYYGLALSQVAKISKLVHLVCGKDEDEYQDCALLSFLGIDNYLRCYLYWFGEWHQVSPLLMGLKSLRLLAQHRDVKYFHQIGKKENSAIPCISGQTWISYWPSSAQFLETISKECDVFCKCLQ